MATRPPSERGVEWQLLDKIDELLKKLDNPQPVNIKIDGNWFDRIPFPKELIPEHANGYQTYYNLWSTGYLQLNLISQIFLDKIELRLRAKRYDHLGAYSVLRG